MTSLSLNKLFRSSIQFFELYCIYCEHFCVSCQYFVLKLRKVLRKVLNIFVLNEVLSAVLHTTFLFMQSRLLVVFNKMKIFSKVTNLFYSEFLKIHKN